MAALNPDPVKRVACRRYLFLAGRSFAAPWSLRLFKALDALIPNQVSHLLLALLHLALQLSLLHQYIFLHFNHLGLDAHLGVLGLLFAARRHFEDLALAGDC